MQGMIHGREWLHAIKQQSKLYKYKQKESQTELICGESKDFLAILPEMRGWGLTIWGRRKFERGLQYKRK